MHIKLDVESTGIGRAAHNRHKTASRTEWERNSWCGGSCSVVLKKWILTLDKNTDSVSVFDNGRKLVAGG